MNSTKEFTISTHIIVSLSVTILIWFLFVKPITSIGPNKSLNIMFFTMFVWCILFPIIIFVSGTYKDSITEESTGESIFVLLKFISVIVALLAIQAFIIMFYYKKWKNMKVMTGVLSLILIINIGEACITQFNMWKNSIKNNKTIDLINSIVGAFLCIIIAIKFFNKPLMSITKNTNIQLVSKFDIWFILAYTAWNLLFRSRLGESTVIVIFTLSTLILPIIAHVTKSGDWLQVRTIGLLAYLIVILGFTKGEGRMFPIYNTQGYNKIEDENSIITKIQKENWYNYGLLSMGILTVIPSLYKVIKH